MRSGLVVVAVIGLLALDALLCLWVWRDMAWRKRPTWLRVVVIALQWPTMLGLFIWMLDRSRHPHESTVTRREQLRQPRDKRTSGA